MIFWEMLSAPTRRLRERFAPRSRQRLMAQFAEWGATPNLVRCCRTCVFLKVVCRIAICGMSSSHAFTFESFFGPGFCDAQSKKKPQWTASANADYQEEL